MHRVQRYFNAKSICHYANDAYSSYEVLHVIGLSQDYFLFLKDRKWGKERGRNIQRKGIEEEEWRDEEGAPKALEVAHSAFIVLCFRENIFLIFEEFLEEGWRRAEVIKRRREEIVVEAKGDIEGWEKRKAKEKQRFFFSEENIFFICKMMREIAIITITEASNNEWSVLRTEGTMGGKEDTLEICYERAKRRGSGIAEEDFQYRSSSTSRRYRESNKPLVTHVQKSLFIRLLNAIR